MSIPLKYVKTASRAVVMAALSLCAPLAAQAMETQARQAIVVDYNTGTILMEKNADELMTPSSMSKLMTVYLVFSHLRDGSLKMTDRLPVSNTAWSKFYKTDASLMFLPVHSQATVADLLRGVIIQSGDDACSVLAEGIAGSEEAFAEEETRKSREIGLTASTFKNASGWPEPGHLMTARDLATLSIRLIHDFPEYYPIFAERSFTYNHIKQDNRNPLIWQNIPGADGLKTGHTQDGGFGVDGTAERDGRRVIVVLNGLPSNRARAEESARLIEWAFRAFEDYRLFQAGETVTNADVWQGTSGQVPLVAGQDIAVTLPRGSRNDMKVAVSYTGPLTAPIRKGARVASLEISAPGVAPMSVPLVAGANVPKRSGLSLLWFKFSHLLGG